MPAGLRVPWTTLMPVPRSPRVDALTLRLRLLGDTPRSRNPACKLRTYIVCANVLRGAKPRDQAGKLLQGTFAAKCRPRIQPRQRNQCPADLLGFCSEDLKLLPPILNLSRANSHRQLDKVRVAGDPWWRCQRSHERIQSCEFRIRPPNISRRTPQGQRRSGWQGKLRWPSSYAMCQSSHAPTRALESRLPQRHQPSLLFLEPHSSPCH